MITYRAPLADIRFLLGSVLDYDGQVATLPGHADADLDAVMDVLEAGAAFCESELLPLNRVGDVEGCAWSPAGVRTPPGFRDAFGRLAEAGWPGISLAPEHGGSGLPQTVQVAHKELICATNLAFATYMLLSQGAYRAIDAHGDDDQRARFLPALASGRWTGTMCLTEPQAGTDLGLLRTHAEPGPDGSYRLSGQKIYITAGDHDLAENILHLVLARLPDAPPGTRGISLFAVPRTLPDGTANGVVCTAIEHKMGIRGSATCTLVFEDARGELIGQPHRGLPQMFTMMNASRLSVGTSGLALAEAAYQRARAYAAERLQGRAIGGATHPEQPADPILDHVDVRRQLLRIRTQVEAGRALVLWIATRLDVAKRHPDAAERAAADDLVALMTPVIKAGLTDLGWEAAALAQGIFGGAGYVVETGIEQLVRDVRITQIYEGTNAVQALDLVLRKLPEGDGRLLRRLIHPAIAWLDAHDGDHSLADIVAGARDGIDVLGATSLDLLERAAGDREEAAAGASEYLRLVLLATSGYLWARMACAALDAPEIDPGLREAKVAGARFYIRHVLPEAGALAQSIASGKGALGAFPANQL